MERQRTEVGDWKPEIGLKTLERIGGLEFPRVRFVESKVMPTVFEKDGYRFFFYRNEHRPIQVQVRYRNGEAVFNIENEVALRESEGLKIDELSKAQQHAEENRHLLIREWNEHLE